MNSARTGSNVRRSYQVFDKGKIRFQINESTVIYDVSAVTAKRLGLHPWRMIVERYGADRPSKLKRAIVSVPDEDRYAWMRAAVGLDHGARGELRLHGYASREIIVNVRIIDHIREEPQRAPYLSWVPTALTSPIEVWRGHRVGERGLEPRLYYLYATARPTMHNIAVIVGEQDLVAFNVIPFEPKDAKKFRVGELCFGNYDQPFGRCPHGCCERHELA